MSENFETFNKQLATFIVVSGALSMPAFAELPAVNNMVIDRYAGPVMPLPEPNVDPRIIARYAGPVLPDKPDVDPRIIARYAGPVMPAHDATSTDAVVSGAEAEVKSAENRYAESKRAGTSAVNIEGDKLGPGHFKF